MHLLSIFGHNREVFGFTPSSVRPDGIPIKEDSLRMASIAAYAASVTVRPWYLHPLILRFLHNDLDKQLS